MDLKYIELFKELCHATEILSEQVLNYDKDRKDEDGAKNAEIMRKDYASLYDRIRSKNFKPESLTYADYAKILLGAIIVSQNIETRIKTQQTALTGYKIDLIPKLERIINEHKPEDDIHELVNELFEINT